MEKTIDEVKADYKETIATLYLDRTIDYSPEMDSIFVRGTHSFGGYQEGTLKKVLTSDVDETITIGEHLTTKWIDGLSQINRLINRFHDEFLHYMNSIPSLNQIAAKQTVETFSKRLVECKLHYKEFEEASSYAAHKIELANHSRDLIHKLERMGYIVSLNSGSPQKCVEFLGQRLDLPKNGVNQFGVYQRLFGSRYKFDFDNGYFTGKIISGLDNKGVTMETIVRNNGCPPSLSIFMSDDPETDKVPGSMAGLTIWTINRSWLKELFGYEFPGKIKVTCLDAKKDMNILLDYIKRWDLLNVVIYLRTPEAEKKVFDLARKFKESKETGLKSKENFHTYKNEFLDFAYQLLGVVDPIITDRNLNVFDSLHGLTDSENVEMDKSLMEDIFNSLKDRIPEIQAPKKLGDELNSIIDEKQLFKDLDWWLP